MITGGATHEWFTDERVGGAGRRVRWTPALTAVVAVLRRVAEEGESAGPFVWIGRACWPAPLALHEAGPDLLKRSIFVSPTGRADRQWAMELVLRHPGVAGLMADASGLSFADSRRLQLAAEEGGTVGLLVRPCVEIDQPSAARTRWRVMPQISSDSDQRWTVELLRCKGVRPVEERARRWAVQRAHGKGDVGVVSVAGDRAVEETSALRLRRA
ncbi:MAG: hypothetical protein SFZ24_11410 [Planctomycetota bacterium]|nr:hypothetical protein [Planctomycetota bacterium]